RPAPVSYPAITLNLVPTSAFNVLGTIAVFEVAPAAATMTSRARAAAMVLTSEWCQVAQTFCNFPMLPSQLNFLRVVARARVAEQRVHGRAIGEGGDGRAVLVGRAVERAGGGKPGRGRHVLGDDVGIAGNVARQMTSEDACIGVIASAGAAADQHGDRF